MNDDLDTFHCITDVVGAHQVAGQPRHVFRVSEFPIGLDARPLEDPKAVPFKKEAVGDCGTDEAAAAEYGNLHRVMPFTLVVAMVQ